MSNDILTELKEHLEPLLALAPNGAHTLVFVGAIKEIRELRQQRDELLEALKFAQKKIEELHIDAGDDDCHYPRIDDAIEFAQVGAGKTASTHNLKVTGAAPEKG